MRAEDQELTALLRAWGKGDAGAGDRLLPVVYAELRRLAAAYLKRERSDHTLHPTALVNEAYLRLVGQRGDWQCRSQFFGVAAQVMRRILVDHARARKRSKRAGGWTRVPLDEAGEIAVLASPDVDLLLLEEALDELAALDPRQAKLVELRFFAGLSIADAAAALDVSTATVNRDWKLAKAWLYRRMQRGGSTQPR